MVLGSLLKRASVAEMDEEQGQETPVVSSGLRIAVLDSIGGTILARLSYRHLQFSSFRHFDGSTYFLATPDYLRTIGKRH